MGVFKSGMFGRRGVVSTPKEQETPARPPVRCDVCGLEGHDREGCWTTIRTRADVERTWGRLGNPDWSTGDGDTFEAAQDFWRRFRGVGD